MADALGMMDGAYFVGRAELLTWLNGLLELRYSKVEQVASAAAVLQVFDAIHPDVVPMSRVDYAAKLPYQFVNNYKLLQKVFDKLAIEKHLDVNRLTKGRYQDNLEFLQWVKAYYDSVMGPGGHPADYDPVSRRALAKGGATAPGTAPVAARREAGNKENRAAASRSTAAAPKRAQSSAMPKPALAPKVDPALRVELDEAKKQVEDLEKEIREMQQTMEDLMGERDCYFAKLTEVEVECTTYPDQGCRLIENIQNVLYKDQEGASSGAGERPTSLEQRERPDSHPLEECESEVGEERPEGVVQEQVRIVDERASSSSSQLADALPSRVPESLAAVDLPDANTARLCSLDVPNSSDTEKSREAPPRQAGSLERMPQQSPQETKLNSDPLATLNVPNATSPSNLFSNLPETPSNDVNLLSEDLHTTLNKFSSQML